MSDELDMEREERRLEELFAAVPAPRGLEGRCRGAAPRRRGRLVGRLLIGAPGERRLRPLAAALIVPVLVLAVAGGAGLRARLGSSGSGGAGPSPPARASAGMAFDAAHGDVVMFGGRGLAGPLDDTWTWDGSSWTQQHPSVSPPAMASPVMAADPATGRVLLVGTAHTSQPTGQSGQTWSWDGSTWREEHPAHQPPSAVSGAMAGDPAHHQVVLEVQGPPVAVSPPDSPATPPGGGPVAQVTPLIEKPPPPETWTWNGSDWTRHAGNTAPAAGTGAHMAWDQKSHRVVMIGLAPGCTAINTLNGSARSGPPVQGPVPTPRSELGVAPGSPVAVPVGTPHALPISPTPHAGSPTIAFCSGSEATQVNGEAGSSSSAICTACPLWTWDGSVWHRTSLHGAAPLGVGEVADDPATGGVLFTSAGKVWTIIGSSASAADLPRELQRSQAAMAGDPAHHQVVLFGGFAARGMAADTWTWDGKAWTHRAGTVPAAPTPFPVGGVPVPPAIQQTMVPGTACALSRFGGAQAGSPSDRMTYAFSWPGGPCLSQAVTVTLVDASGKALDVRSNGQTVLPASQLSFAWTNWCGGMPVYVQVAMKSATFLERITPPACSDRSAPSTFWVMTGTTVP